MGYQLMRPRFIASSGIMISSQPLTILTPGVTRAIIIVYV